MYTYEYPRPALTVDCVVLAWDGDSLQVLLIERRGEPFASHWACPGGFVELDESLEDAARRELAEETGLQVTQVEQVGAFGGVHRDPRDRIVSVAFMAAIRLGDARTKAASDAHRAGWFLLTETPPLAFDHQEILAATLFRLREQIRRHIRGSGWMTATFTLAELRRLYEAILGEPVSAAKLRRRLLASENVDEVKARGTAIHESRYRFRKGRKYGSLLGNH